MEKEKKVSVIIPVYNAGKTIKGCVDSLIKQSYKNIQIIIVNDGSNDNSLQICNQIKQDNIIIIDKKNEGVSIARNTGIENSDGEYIVFVDSDDYVKEDYISKMVRTIEDDNADWVICNYDIVTKNETTPNNSLESIRKCDINDIDKYLFEIYSRTLLNQPWNKLYKREFIQEKFNPNMSLGEDLIFNLEYMKNIKTFSYINECLYQYNIGTVGTLSGQKQLAKEFFFLYENLYKYINTKKTIRTKEWNHFLVHHYIRFLYEQGKKEDLKTSYKLLKDFQKQMNIKKTCSKIYFYVVFKIYQLIQEKRKK